MDANVAAADAASMDVSFKQDEAMEPQFGQIPSIPGQFPTAGTTRLPCVSSLSCPGDSVSSKGSVGWKDWKRCCVLEHLLWLWLCFFTFHLQPKRGASFCFRFLFA